MDFVAKGLAVVLRNLGIVIGMAMLGVLLLMAVFLMPVAPIESNVARSVPLIEEQMSCSSAEDGAESVVDVFTDSLLLLEASNCSDQSVLMRAMMVYRSQCDDDPVKSLIAQGGGGSNDSTVGISYGRYWHGSLVYLKPLLSLFDLRTIGIIGGVLQGILVLLVVLQLVRLNRPLLALGFILGFFSVSFIALAECLQYWPPVFVMLATCLAVLMAWEKNNASAGRLSLIFSISGAAVNYLDLLTFPLVALAVPMILYFVLEDRFALAKNVFRFVFLSLSWLFSYGIMWILKWVFGSILTGTNYFTDAIDAAGVRSGVSGAPISFSDVFFTNLARYLNNNEIYLIVALTLIALIVLLSFWLYSDANGGIVARRPQIASFLIPVVLASLLVPLWYRSFIQHSFVHPFMTNRDCWIFGFALALAAARLIELLVEDFKVGGRLRAPAKV